jgi:hypothetical protein
MADGGNLTLTQLILGRPTVLWFNLTYRYNTLFLVVVDIILLSVLSGLLLSDIARKRILLWILFHFLLRIPCYSYIRRTCFLYRHYMDSVALSTSVAEASY